MVLYGSASAPTLVPDVADSRGYGQYGVVVETHGEGTRPVSVVDRGDVEAKRQANIAKKERERGEREKNRRKSTAEIDEDRTAQVEAKATKRQEKIKKTEQQRAVKQAKDDEVEKNKPKSKYKRSEIMTLKELFDEYDADGSGSISITELKLHFAKRVEKATNYDGKRKSFADRRAARAGIDLVALVEPMFESIDNDGNGTIAFFELLKAIYPMANEEDFTTFKEWVYPPKPYVPPIQYVLSGEQKQELKDMFKVVDKDRSGEICVNELKSMFFGSAITGDTGIEMDELQGYFDEADFDDSDAISLAEFEKLMVSTGLYTPETLPDDVTPEQLKVLEDQKAAEKVQARYRGNVSRQKTTERFGLKREDTSRFYESGRKGSLR